MCTRLLRACRVGGALLLMAAAACAGCSNPPGPARPAADPPGPTAPRSTAGLATVVGVAPAGAVVSLEPDEGMPVPPDDSLVMDQRGRQFLPAFLMVQVGQAVQFRNSEDIPHNISIVQRRVGRTVLDVSTDPGQQYTHVFERPAELDVTCDIHEGMEATIIVTASPFAAVADSKGRFAVVNVPPGAYTLVVSDAGSPAERSVAVDAPLTDLDARGR